MYGLVPSGVSINSTRIPPSCGPKFYRLIWSNTISEVNKIGSHARVEVKSCAAVLRSPLLGTLQQKVI